jgi:hypothetical protein
MSENLASVGGFQSGFHSRKISREDCKYPQFLICNHGCKHVIQLISHVSGEPEFELCEIEAKKLAKVLIDSIDKC